MPKYYRKVELPGHTADQLYQKVSADIERFLSKTPLPSYELDRQEGDRRIRIESSMFSATLTCEDACIELDGKISLMAVPFKGKLDEGIDRWLERTFKS